MFDLYLITPEREPAQILATLHELLAQAPRGRVGVLLRSKTLAEPARAELARALRDVTRAHAAPLLISADLALARALAADGVQLPERGPATTTARNQLGPHALIGASRHDRAGVLAAERDGATFVTLSPVFAVPDKGSPLGITQLAEIARATHLPVFGLGGIDAARASEVVRAGAHGPAVIREVWDAARPASALTALLDAIDGARAAQT